MLMQDTGTKTLLVQPLNGKIYTARVTEADYIGKKVVAFAQIGKPVEYVMRHGWLMIIVIVGLIVVGSWPERVKIGRRAEG